MKRARVRLLLAGVVLLAVLATGWAFWNRRPTPRQLFQTGAVAASRGDIGTAEHIQAQLAQDPANADLAQALRGGVLVNSRRYAQAVETLDPTLAEGELREPVLVWVGEAFVGLGQLGQAEV